MITLHSVSKIIGTKRFQRTIARNITWTIEPRSKLIILGHQREALSVFLNMIAGVSVPSEGWIERTGSMSIPGGFLHLAQGRTPRHLIDFLAPLYRFEPSEVAAFVEASVKYVRLLDTPIVQLPTVLKRELNMVLIYAIPCDYYVFDGSPDGGRTEVRSICRRALSARSRQAGVIIATGSARTATILGPDVNGAILYRGDFTVYRQVEDALAVFEGLKPEETIPRETMEGEPEGEDYDLIL
jgi:ABC-type polysaccharide/polyol phosphate transport system ATPase subunit